MPRLRFEIGIFVEIPDAFSVPQEVKMAQKKTIRKKSTGKRLTGEKSTGEKSSKKKVTKKKPAGLYANIHKAQRRAKKGGKKVRAKGEKGAPTEASFKKAAKTAKN